MVGGDQQLLLHVVADLVLRQAPAPVAEHLQQELMDALLAPVQAAAADLDIGPLVGEQVRHLAEHTVVDEEPVGMLQPLVMGSLPDGVLSLPPPARW